MRGCGARNEPVERLRHVSFILAPQAAALEPQGLVTWVRTRMDAPRSAPWESQTLVKPQRCKPHRV